MSILSLQLTPEQINKIGCPQIIDITDQLPVNKNYTWAQLAGTRDINDLTTPVLHHDCYPKKNTTGQTDIQLAQEIARDHIKLTKNEPNGDPGFPYQIWIRNGQAYLCNNVLDFTYGVSSNNSYTVHVCISGDYFKYDALTDPDRKALYGVMIALIGVLPNYKEIKGHGEITPTDCPGYDCDRVRNDVRALQAAFEYAKSDAAAKERAYKISNVILFYANLSAGKDQFGNPAKEGDIQWGKNVLLDLEPFLLERNLL